jgi:hypothetical protein
MVVVCWLGLVWTAIDQVIDTGADRGANTWFCSRILEFEEEQTLGYETPYCSKRTLKLSTFRGLRIQRLQRCSVILSDGRIKFKAVFADEAFDAMF